MGTESIYLFIYFPFIIYITVHIFGIFQIENVDLASLFTDTFVTFRYSMTSKETCKGFCGTVLHRTIDRFSTQPEASLVCASCAQHDRHLEA